ncbi:Uma2 family endonuclease [Hymenobacter gummosus]|uniref:Uma2 family endonuclease n=1 Tax=Hymenobacter gummosus TaxID=1776032 RepID=A0A3S0H278_9BACT|nr:Uma2 family endonuclease [Hymenobacter gummosus]RTQ45307.1 Uma2 family endonuclease [Hymenobacter gummosus]
MESPRKRRYTEEEYAAMEYASEFKHEFVDGQIYPWGHPDMLGMYDVQAMSGASLAHNIITGNVSGLLQNALRGKGCRTFGSDMRVYVPLTGTYLYPDALVVCGKPEIQQNGKLDLLTNPVVIIEVLSDSTADYDRSGKFMRYRSIESVRDYLLIDSRSLRVELYSRTETGQWTLTEILDAQGAVKLPSVGATLTVADLYEDVAL